MRQDHLARGRDPRTDSCDLLKPQGAQGNLLASKFANDWGHLGCILATVRACRAAGHEVLLVVSDLSAARFFFAEDNFPVLQAPILRATAPDAWIKLLTQIKPGLLVYINALIAVVAARALHISVIIIGGAFDIPPDTGPLSAFQRLTDPSGRALTELREAEVVRSINSILERFDLPREFLGDLFPMADVRLITLSELDPFGGAAQFIFAADALPVRPFIAMATRTPLTGATRIYE